MSRFLLCTTGMCGLKELQRLCSRGTTWQTCHDGQLSPPTAPSSTLASTTMASPRRVSPSPADTHSWPWRSRYCLLHLLSEGEGKYCVWDQCVSRRRLLTNRRDTEKADCREQSTAQLYWNIANDDMSSWACSNPARICAGLPTGWSEPSRYLLCGSPRHRNSSWRRPGTGRHQQVVWSGRRAKGSSMDWLRQIKHGPLRRMLLLGK